MATTSAEIEAVWRDSLFTREEVLAFTNRVFFYDVSLDSTFRLAELSYSAGDADQPKLNFFLCLVTRQRQEDQVTGGGTGTRYTFQVRLEYYLQQTDIEGSTYPTHRNRLEAVDDLIRPVLGPRWLNTVDYWQGGVPIQPSTVTIDDRACWRGGYTYTAFKAT